VQQHLISSDEVVNLIQNQVDAYYHTPTKIEICILNLKNMEIEIESKVKCDRETRR
jgi:hypothetical protein